MFSAWSALVLAALAVGTGLQAEGAVKQPAITGSQALAFGRGVACGAGSVDGSNYISTWLTPVPGAAASSLPTEAQLHYEVSDSIEFAPDSVVAEGRAVAHAAEQYHATAAVRGLRPGHRYYFRFLVESVPGAAARGLASPPGSFIMPATPDGGHHLAHIAQRDQDGSGPGSASARRLQEGANFTLQLLHINDQHNRIEGIQSSGAACSAANEAAGICIGGFGRIATYIAQMKAAASVPTLVLDAGDQSTGSLWDVVYRNHSATAAMQNYIGFDAMTLGNHEFDNGPDLLAQYMAQLNFAILGGCNIDASAVPGISTKLSKWFVKEVAPGRKVGVLGYLTTETAVLASAGNVRFSDVVSSMTVCVADFRAANPDVNIVIALGHAGYLLDLEVAAQVAGIDLVVGGHSHTFLWGATGQERGPLLTSSNPTSGEASMGPYPTFVTGPSGRQVPVVQAAFWSKYVGALSLTFSSAGDLLSISGAPALMGGSASSNNVTRDAGILGIIAAYEAPVRTLSGSVVGNLASGLSADRAVVRAAEAPLGNLVCDAMMWYMESTTDLSIDACITNGGGLRAALPAGNVTTGDVLTLLPFGNTLVVKNVSGLAIISALENAMASNWAANEQRGAFSQVAGLKLVFSTTPRPNSRVLSVQVQHANGTYADVDPCAYYTVVTNNYMADGGDSYTSLKAGQTLYGNGPALDLAVIEYLKTISPVANYSAAEGRITRCEANSTSAACATPRAYGSCPVAFQLLHFNDVHNRIEAATSSGSACSASQESAGQCYGGMARLATSLKQARERGFPTVVLDAGDESVGTLYDVVYRDRQPTAAAQNALGVDAFTLGNHEFDFGVASLNAFLAKLNAPVLACNVRAATNASAAAVLLARIKKYAVVEVGGTGVRMGVVGWVTPETAFISNPGVDIAFDSVVPSAAGAVALLKADFPDVKLIVGLSHAGLASDMDVASQVPDLDLIVGAHDHYFLYADGKTPGPRLDVSSASSGQVPYREYPVLVNSSVQPGKVLPITQAFFASRYLGQLNLTFDPAGNLTAYSGQPQLLGGAVSANNVARDASMLSLIGQFSGNLTSLNSAVLGTTLVALSSSRTTARVREAPLGNLACDAFLWYLRNATSIVTPDLAGSVCVVNGGGLRADIDAGNITAAEVFAVLPFGNVITVLNVTGAQLISALENGVSGELTLLNDLAGRFPQVSGLEFTYLDTQPVGSRVLSVFLRPAGPGGPRVAVDPCKSYALLTNDFMAGGGDNYVVLRQARVLYGSGPPMADVLMSYVQAFSPLSPATEGRITRCSDANATCPAAREVPTTCGAASPAPAPALAPAPSPSPSPLPAPPPQPAPAPPPLANPTPQPTPKPGGKKPTGHKRPGKGKPKRSPPPATRAPPSKTKRRPAAA